MQSGKAYRGMGMNGVIAKWHAKTGGARHEQFQHWAQRVAESSPGPDVLEVAPGL